MTVDAPLVRTSERSTFTTCPWSWKWAYVDRLKPREEGPALRFGTLVHKALEAYYVPGRKRGPHPAETFNALYGESLAKNEAMGFRDEDGKWAKAGDLGPAMLQGYIEKWGDDRQWEVLGSEVRFQVPMRRSAGRRAPLLCQYVGTLDGIWRNLDTGLLWLVDHKTAAAIWSDQLKLDEQASAYWMAAPTWLRRKGILKKGEKLEGIIFNFLKKSMPDDRPKNELGQSLNQDGSVSKKQQGALFERTPVYRSAYDRASALRRTRMQVSDINRLRAELAEPGAVPEDILYKTPARQHCGWCGFRDMCELHETGADWEQLRDLTMTTWEPYAEHEILEEGKGR